jgi:hypothetical protein
LTLFQISGEHVLSKDTLVDGSVEECGLLCRSNLWTISSCLCVSQCSNLPVLMELKASPSKPSLSWSCWNWALIVSASSTACLVTVTPPTWTVSV